MKTALITLNINDVLCENSRASFKDAAARWGCDYLEITKARDGVHSHAMKLLAFEFCDADRIMYIDADTIIRRDTPDPFLLYPPDAFVAVMNNQAQMSDSCRNACEDVIANDFQKISKQYPELVINAKEFVNSGFWIAHREHHADVLKLAFEISIKMYDVTAWRDQSALNYALLSFKTPILKTNPEWNYQFPQDTKDGMMEEYIYHWAGGENRDQIPGINWREIPKRKMLAIADHNVDTGFARVAENLCANLKDMGWEIEIIGINHNGTPHKFDYPIWPAKLYGDIWGIGTFGNLIGKILPQLVFTVQDPWIAARYATEINRGFVPLVAYMPIDAKNQSPNVCDRLNALNLAIFYTRFGEVQCRLAGYKGAAAVIPHGVDTSIYYPTPKDECIAYLNIFQHDEKVEVPKDSFIIGNVNRNQPRKRLDLSIEYFAEWIRRVAGCPQKIEDAYLYLHCALNDAVAWDLAELAHYYGISDRIILCDPNTVSAAKGFPEENMRYVYGSFDVQINTGEGEGWGLPQLEGMACGIPQIVPQFAALGEWAAGAAYFVPCREKSCHPVINTEGAIPDKEAFIDALDLFYHDRKIRKQYADRALKLAQDPMFKWENIAKQFDRHFRVAVESACIQAAQYEAEQKKKGKDNGEAKEKSNGEAI